MRRLRVPTDPNNPNPLVDNTSFDLGSRFEIPAIVTRFLGGMNVGRDQAAGQGVMQQVLDKGRKLDPSQYSFDDQVRLIKDALDRVQKQLLNTGINPEVAEKMKQQASRALEVYSDMRRDAEGARSAAANPNKLMQDIANLEVQKRNLNPQQDQTQIQQLEREIQKKSDLLFGGTAMADKLDAMSSVALGGVGSRLSNENQQKLQEFMMSSAMDTNLDASQAFKAAEKAAAGLSAQETIKATTGGRFFTGGGYKSYMDSQDGHIEAGSSEFKELADKSRQGISESLREIQTAKKYKEGLGGIGGMLGGISAKDLGIDEGKSRKELAASLQASKDRLREITRDEDKIKKERDKATKGLTGEEREAAARPYEEQLTKLQGERKDLSSSAMKAAQELSENIKRPFMEAGAHFKSAMSGVIGVIGKIGSELSNQLNGLAKATLNPVVGDLIDSIKYGLSIGIQAGTMISNVTKNALDGAAKTFGIGGGLGNLLGAGGALGKLAKAGGLALGGAAAGYGLGELIRGGISKDAREGRIEMTEAEKRTNVWAGTTQGAITGAGMGAILGPWGALAGAAVGGTIGWFNSKKTADESAAKALENQQQEKKARSAQEEAKRKEGLAAGFLPGISSFADIDKMLNTKLGTIPGIGDVNAGGIGKTLLATGAAGVIGGNLPGAGAARGLFAASAGLLGGAAVGAAATVVDFFIKSLQRGAEELGKFSQISNNINVGMSMQLRRIGNVQGEGKRIGERTKLTEADLAQSLLTGTKLIDIGFNREQVGAAYATMNRTSYEGTAGATRTIELAGRAARQLGVDINEMIKSYSEADVLGGVGKGSDVFNKLLFNIAPRTEDGDVSAMSKAYTEAILNSARQLQMGSKTIDAGSNIAGLLGSMSKATEGLNNSFSKFAQLSPQVYGETVGSVNNFLKGGLGGDPLALSFAARAGLDRRVMYEGIQSTGDFEAVINSIGGMLSGDPALLANGQITELAKKTVLPDLLNKILPGVSTEQFSSFYSLTSQGKVSEAYKEYEKEGKPMDLKEIAKQIGQGFNALQKAAEEGMQQNLKLMESNMGALRELSDTSNKVAGNLLSMGKTFLTPAIQSLNYPMKILSDITKLANDTIKQQNAKKEEEEKEKFSSIPGFGVALARDTLGMLDPKNVDTEQERLRLSREQFSLETAEELAERTVRRTLGGIGMWAALGSHLESVIGNLSVVNQVKSASFMLSAGGAASAGALMHRKEYIADIFENLKNEVYVSGISAAVKSSDFQSKILGTNIVSQLGIGTSLANLYNRKDLSIGGLSFKQWFEGYNKGKENEDAAVILRDLAQTGRISTEQAKMILQMENVIDIIRKAAGDNVDISSTLQLAAYAAGGAKGASDNPILNAILSAKQYVFLANDMSVMPLEEFNRATQSNVK